MFRAYLTKLTVLHCFFHHRRHFDKDPESLPYQLTSENGTYIQASLRLSPASSAVTMPPEPK